jgi:recombinase
MNSQRPKAAKAADLLPLILPMKAGGAALRQIADGLNRCGVPAARGGDWSAVAVKRILNRQVRQTAAFA